MKIKVKDNEVNIPAWLAVLAVLVADNMYANRCKNKAFKKYADVLKDLEVKKD